jgi:hypothetical protein
MLTQSIAALLLLGTGITPSPGPNKILAADVQLAWADSTHTNVRVTWSEAKAAPNVIVLEREGSDDLQLGQTAVDAPNALVIPTTSLQSSPDPGEVDRIRISEPTGEEARSVGFDRYVRGDRDPELSFTPDGSVRWTLPPEAGPDGTPNDPLDLDQPTRYVPRLDLDELPHTNMDCGEVVLPTTTVPSGVIANRHKPYDLVLSVINEWRPSGGFNGWSHLTTTALTIAASASTAFGTPVAFSGTVTGRYIYQSGHPPACQDVGEPSGGVLVVLQARNTSTSAWYEVTRTQTDATGKYSFSVRNPGAREYRATIPNAAGTTATYGSSTAPKAVKATTRVMSAKFITPSIKLGAKAQAYLWVDPAGTQRAALQFKNPSGVWQGLTYKSLYAGRGLVTFGWSRRGATQFRWWIPGSTTSTGLKVDPVYTGPFTLTVT